MSVKGLGRVASCSQCVSQHLAWTARNQQRNFASSSILQRHGAVPGFKNIVTPGLAEILNKLRELVILPSHLSKEQKSLIYRQKHRKTLQYGGAKAHIAGEEFILRPVDVTKDIPSVRSNLFEVIKLMSTKEEWENLPSLLTGLGQTRLNLRKDFNKIVSRAGKAGRQDVILECARQAHLTKLPLNDPQVVQQILWWFQWKAVSGDFKAEETKRILSWCEQIFRLMDDPAKSNIKPNSVDPRSQPEVVGILLQLAAVRASKHMSGKDEDKKVEKYAEKLLGTSMDIKIPNTENLHDRSFWLAKTVPVLHGMKVATSVLEPASDVVKELNARISDLESKVLQVYELVVADVEKSGFTPTGLQLYQKLLAEKS